MSTTVMYYLNSLSLDPKAEFAICQTSHRPLDYNHPLGAWRRKRDKGNSRPRFSRLSRGKLTVLQHYLGNVFQSSNTRYLDKVKPDQAALDRERLVQDTTIPLYILWYIHLHTHTHIYIFIYHVHTYMNNGSIHILYIHVHRYECLCIIIPRYFNISRIYFASQFVLVQRCLPGPVHPAMRHRPRIILRRKPRTVTGTLSPCPSSCLPGITNK